jgi:hypothetical protein
MQTPPPTITTLPQPIAARNVFRTMPITGGPTAATPPPPITTTTATTITNPGLTEPNQISHFGLHTNNNNTRQQGDATTILRSKRFTSPDLPSRILQEQHNQSTESLEQELLKDILSQLRDLAVNLDSDEWKYHKYQS